MKRRRTEKGYYGEKEQHCGEELAGEASVLAKLATGKLDDENPLRDIASTSRS